MLEEHRQVLVGDRDEPAVRAEAAKVGERLGPNVLDGLVNNAGIEIAGPLSDLSADQFRNQLDVNLVGPHIVTQAFLPLLGADGMTRMSAIMERLRTEPPATIGGLTVTGPTGRSPPSIP